VRPAPPSIPPLPPPEAPPPAIAAPDGIGISSPALADAIARPVTEVSTACTGISLPSRSTARSSVKARCEVWSALDLACVSVTRPRSLVPRGSFVPSASLAALVVLACTASPTFAFFVSIFFVSSALTLVDAADDDDNAACPAREIVCPAAPD
jgi:hypothetical protein